MAKMETVHVDVRPHIVAVARPGDTVLIGFAHALTDEDIEALNESFQPLIDEGRIKVGYMDQVTSMVVVKGPERDVSGAPLTRTLADENPGLEER